MTTYLPTAKITVTNFKAIDEKLLQSCTTTCTGITQFEPTAHIQFDCAMRVDIRAGHIPDPVKAQDSLIWLAGELATTDELIGQPFTITLVEVGLTAGVSVICEQSRRGTTVVRIVYPDTEQKAPRRPLRPRGQAPSAEALALFNLTADAD